MRLHDLVKPITEMSDEELHAYLLEIRRRKSVERPATIKREKKAERKSAKAKVSSMDKILSQLSPEERETLLKELETQQNGEG